jgi:hypothetical protein
MTGVVGCDSDRSDTEMMIRVDGKSKTSKRPASVFRDFDEFVVVTTRVLKERRNDRY